MTNTLVPRQIHSDWFPQHHADLFHIWFICTRRLIGHNLPFTIRIWYLPAERQTSAPCPPPTPGPERRWATGTRPRPGAHSCSRSWSRAWPQSQRRGWCPGPWPWVGRSRMGASLGSTLHSVFYIHNPLKHFPWVVNRSKGNTKNIAWKTQVIWSHIKPTVAVQ